MRIVRAVCLAVATVALVGIGPAFAEPDVFGQGEDDLSLIHI